MTHTRHAGLLHTFCLKMNRWHYMRVFIWDCTESMWAVHPKLGRDYYGLAITGPAWFPSTGRVCFARKFGEVHLYENGYNTKTIAHEMMHMLGYWIQAKKWSFDKNDEQIARLSGSLNYDFWKMHVKLKKISKKEGGQ